MLKIKILSIGKFKDQWLEIAINSYEKRLTGVMQIEWKWAKDNKQLIEWAQKEPTVVCLDPLGHMHSSEEFSQFLFKNLEGGGSRLAIIVGGSEGLPIEMKKNYPLISFSRLTFTHQMTYLILIEQIYRALEIRKGSDYHK